MHTPKLHWTVYLWPGLAQLWIRGSWAGLVVAVGFTALANVLLLASLVFTEWLTFEARLTCAGALLVTWLMAWWQSRHERRKSRTNVSDDPSLEVSEAPQVESEREQLFREAQQCYLRNDWVATEKLLLRLLKQDSRDVESRLMLATLWRHQGRGEEALRQLDRLERLEAAEKWQYEIHTEREAINHAVQQDESSLDSQAALKQEEAASDEEQDRQMAA